MSILSLRPGILGIVLLASCTSRLPYASVDKDLVSSDVSVATTEEYRIGTDDALDIKFFYHPELNESVTVRPDGRISLQLIPEVRAAGSTPRELQAHLLEQYQGQITKPEISVIVRTFARHKVFFDGEIARPGAVPLSGTRTLMQAIPVAGGLKDTALRSDILVIRGAAEQNIETITVDLTQILDGSNPSADIELHPMDIVFIPKTPIANVNMWVDKYLRKNLPLPLMYNMNP